MSSTSNKNFPFISSEHKLQTYTFKLPSSVLTYITERNAANWNAESTDAIKEKCAMDKESSFQRPNLV